MFSLSATSVYWTAVLGLLALTGVLTMTWWRLRQQRLAGETIAPMPTWVEAGWQAGINLLRHDIPANDRYIMQLVVGLAGVFISISLGYGYGRISLVDGWQLWTWALTCIILVVALMPTGRWPIPLRVPWQMLLGLSIIGLLLRIPFLDTVPGGLHVDEMGVAGYAMRHVYPPNNLTINPFHTGASSQPALFHYLVRLSFALFGYTFTALRGLSAVAGTLAIVATYFVVATFANRRTALITAVLLTTYHFHIHWSRIGLNNIWDTLWVPLILAPFAWGYRRNWSGGAVIAGVALGLAQYFYAGNKISLFMLLFLLVKLLREETDYRRMWIHGGKLTVTAVAIGAPVTIFAFMLPDVYFARSRVVWGWSLANIQATIGEVDYGRFLWHQIWRNVGSFTTIPDITGFYGPGVPYLIGVAAPLFVIGVLWLIWRRNWLPILWLLLTLIFGGVLIGGAPSSSHHVVMIPAICWATAVPLNWLWTRGYGRLALFLLLIIIATDLIFYFGVYVPAEPRDLFNNLPDLPVWP